MNCRKIENNSLKYVLLFTLIFSGCMNSGCAKQQQKFTKVVQLPAESLSAGLNFQTKTYNGSIDIRGSDVSDCNVTATVTAYARKIKDAQKAVEQTILNLERSDKGVVLKISSPKDRKNRSVSVNLDITLPAKTNLNLESYNGNVTINNIEGDTKAITYNGNITAKNVTGATKLQTNNGQIDARDISGDIRLLSYNGMVNAVYKKTADPNCNITMETYNGSIDLTPPQNYSARANIFTYNGIISTSLPVTVSGMQNKNSLIGIIHDDKNELKLRTHNGSINIR